MLREKLPPHDLDAETMNPYRTATNPIRIEVL